MARANDDFRSLGEFGKALEKITTKLRPDGPELDFALLVDYIDDELDPATKQQVEQYIVTWRAWYDAFWEMVGAQRAGNDCPVADEADLARRGPIASSADAARIYYCKFKISSRGEEIFRASATDDDDDPAKPDLWSLEPITLPAAVAHDCYRRNNVTVSLKLHKIPLPLSSLFEPQLEVSPPPSNGILSVLVMFPNADQRLFCFRPPSRRNKSSVHSLPVEPVSSNAFPSSDQELSAIFSSESDPDK